MKTVDIHQVDAFTDQLFGGNPAGVVTNGDGLTSQEMQKIAREMNLSETAFVLKPTSDESDVKLRFFTPIDEVKFCGHATVSALFQLTALNMFGLDKESGTTVRVETGVGILPMSVTNTDKHPEITFTAPRLTMQPFRLQNKDFAKEFGIPTRLIHPDGTILHDTVLNYVYVPTASLKLLGEQVFDFSQVRKNFKNEKIVVFCFFSSETIKEVSDLHARGLAPNIGVDEDPFTGSMQAGLVYAAKQNNYIDSNKKVILTEQGNFIGRPGFAKVTHDSQADITTVTANAVQVFSTKIALL